MFTATFTDEAAKWFQKLAKKDAGAYQYLRTCIRDLEHDGHRYARRKALGEGLFEIKTHLKYRVYYRFEDDRIILVVSAGDKDSQSRDIRKAKKGKPQ